ncbi:MAG: Second mannosyl transferase, partial [Parcubacteria group bacterium Athens0714_24]
FVMTSRYEGLPYALLEAQSAGLSIIATAVGGIPEIIKNGILVESGDLNGFKEIISTTVKKLFS